MLIDYHSKSNVLLDSEGKAYLADFGLSNIVAEACGPSYVTSSIGGSIRWAGYHLRPMDRMSAKLTQHLQESS